MLAQSGFNKSNPILAMVTFIGYDQLPNFALLFLEKCRGLLIRKCNIQIFGELNTLDQKLLTNLRFIKQCIQ